MDKLPSTMAPTANNAVAFLTHSSTFQYRFVGFLILLAFIALQAGVIYFYVWPRLKIARAALGSNLAVASASGVWAKAMAHLIGIKTMVVGMVGSFFLVLPDLLTQLRLVDFSGTWLAAYQPYIAIATIIIMLLFHSNGVEKAAQATPPGA